MKALYKFFSVPKRITPNQLITSLMNRLEFKTDEFPYCKFIQHYKSSKNDNSYSLRLEIHGKNFHDQLYKKSTKYSHSKREITLQDDVISFITVEASHEKLIIHEMKKGGFYDGKVFQVKKDSKKNIYDLHKLLLDKNKLNIEYIADSKDSFYVAVEKKEDGKSLIEILNKNNMKHRASHNYMTVVTMLPEDARDRINHLKRFRNDEPPQIKSKSSTARNPAHKRSTNEQKKAKKRPKLENRSKTNREVQQISAMSSEQLTKIVNSATQQALAPFQALLSCQNATRDGNRSTADSNTCYMMVPMNLQNVHPQMLNSPYGNGWDSRIQITPASASNNFKIPILPPFNLSS